MPSGRALASHFVSRQLLERFGVNGGQSPEAERANVVGIRAEFTMRRGTRRLRRDPIQPTGGRSGREAASRRAGGLDSRCTHGRKFRDHEP